MDVPFYNVLRSIQLLQNQTSFKAIVFTNSSWVVNATRRHHVFAQDIIPRNEFGMPLIREMLLFAKRKYSADYYGYTNSDILLNPGLFKQLKVVSKAIATKELPKQVELAARAGSTHVGLKTVKFTDIQSYAKSLRGLGKRSIVKTQNGAVG